MNRVGMNCPLGRSQRISSTSFAAKNPAYATARACGHSAFSKWL